MRLDLRTGALPLPFGLGGSKCTGVDLDGVTLVAVISPLLLANSKKKFNGH